MSKPSDSNRIRVSSRQLVIASTVLALVLVIVGLAIPSRGVVVASYHDNTPTPVPPTPESGNRTCAVSRLVGYTMPGGGHQFYFVNSQGNGQKLGGFSPSAMAQLLSSPVGTTLTLTAPDGQILTLTSRGNGSFDASYGGASTTCS